MLLAVCQLSRDVIGYEDLILSVLSLTSLLKSPSIDRFYTHVINNCGNVLEQRSFKKENGS